MDVNRTNGAALEAPLDELKVLGEERGEQNAALQEDIRFLQAQVEAHARAEAELRIALREALRVMPKALDRGNATEMPEAQTTEQTAEAPIEAQRPARATDKLPLSRAPLWLRFFWIRWKR